MTSYKEKYEHEKYWKKYFIFLTILLSFMMFGVTMNHLVLKTNGGRMPVYKTSFDTDTHFGYWNKSEINFPFLTDRIVIGERGILSIGDMFMITGITIYSLYLWFAGIFIFEKWKKKKKK